MNQYLDSLDELESKTSDLLEDETLNFLSDLDDDEEDEEEEFEGLYSPSLAAPLYVQDTANVGMIST